MQQNSASCVLIRTVRRAMSDMLRMRFGIRIVHLHIKFETRLRVRALSAGLNSN